MKDLTLLLVTDPVTYAKHVRSMLLIDAEAQVAKARIDYVARMARHKMMRELKRLKETDGNG